MVVCELIWRKERVVWAIERQNGFTERFLLGSYMETCSSNELRCVMVHFDFFVKK